VTDVLQVQFRPTAPADCGTTWLAFSPAYESLEGAAEVLEVPSTDLNATVAYAAGTDALPPIIIYDDVPGGAGLGRRVSCTGS